MRDLTVHSATLVLLAALAASASAQNLVQNPSFEDSPAFSSYTVIGAPSTSSMSTFGGTTTLPTDGSVYALFGFQGASDGITQQLPTVAGTIYTLKFDLRAVSARATSGAMNASMDVSLGSALNVTITSLAGTPWTTYSFTYAGAGNNDTLGFASHTSFDGVYALDNLSVTPVPEPASIAALSLGALAVLRRRKKA